LKWSQKGKTEMIDGGSRKFGEERIFRSVPAADIMYCVWDENTQDRFWRANLVAEAECLVGT
jgi:hypothetical protein